MPQLSLTSVVKVLDHQLEKFQNEVAKLNAKAIKFGQAQITLKKRRVGEYTVRWEDASRDGSVRASYLVAPAKSISAPSTFPEERSAQTLLTQSTCA